MTIAEMNTLQGKTVEFTLTNNLLQSSSLPLTKFMTLKVISILDEEITCQWNSIYIHFNRNDIENFRIV